MHQVINKVPDWVMGDFAPLFTSNKRPPKDHQKGSSYFNKSHRKTRSSTMNDPQYNGERGLHYPGYDHDDPHRLRSSSYDHDAVGGFRGSHSSLRRVQLSFADSQENCKIHYSDSDEAADRDMKRQASNKSRTNLSRSGGMRYRGTAGAGSGSDDEVGESQPLKGSKSLRSFLPNRPKPRCSMCRDWLETWKSPFFRPPPKLTSLPNMTEGRSLWAARRRLIEPKTYLANERTYLKWIGASTFIASISLILLHVEELSHLGYIFLPFAIITVFYATLLYRKRIWFLEDREAVHMYADMCGPLLLTILLLITFLTSALFTNGSSTHHTTPYPALRM